MRWARLIVANYYKNGLILYKNAQVLRIDLLTANVVPQFSVVHDETAFGRIRGLLVVLRLELQFTTPIPVGSLR